MAAVNFFVYAKGLRGGGSCDCIIGATVYGGHGNFWWTDPRKFVSFAGDNLLFHFGHFGVLGEAQREYFRSILEKETAYPFYYRIVDVAKSIPSYIDYLNPRNSADVAFQSSRLEMTKNVMRLLGTSSSKSSTADWVIPEKVSPDSDDKFRLPEKIRKIDIVVHAVGSKKNFDEIVVWDVRHGMGRFFEKESEFVRHARRVASDDGTVGAIGDLFGVFGIDQLDYFERLMKPVRKVDIVDLSAMIPRDIDFICLDRDHARYHARRIEYFNGLRGSGDLIQSRTPPPIGMEYREDSGYYLKRWQGK